MALHDPEEYRSLRLAQPDLESAAERLRVTREQASNLLALALHLRSLPEGYAGFNMDWWYVRDGWRQHFVSAEPVRPACGTVACAAGHGPSAGIAPLREEPWTEYVARVFGTCGGAEAPERHGLHLWCFSEMWGESIFSSHRDAATRILRALHDPVSLSELRVDYQTLCLGYHPLSERGSLGGPTESPEWVTRLR